MRSTEVADATADRAPADEGVEAGDVSARLPRRPGGAVPLVGARAFLGLDRVDLAWLVGIVLVAFAMRVASPVFPDWLSHPFQGAPVSAWGLGTPYNASGCLTEGVAAKNGSLLPVTTQVTQNGRPTTIKTPLGGACGFVFDEVYFPVDATHDLRQPPDDYFDPEPPLTKLLMAPAISFLGFGTWSWRITCAIAGSLVVGLVYLIARRLRDERFFAVVAATAIGLDGLELVESRTGVIDIIAVLLALLAFYVFLLHWGARTRRQWLATLYGFALALGLAFGAKLTAIAPLVVAAGLCAVRFGEPAIRRVLRLRGTPAGEAQIWRDAAGGWRAALHYGAAALLTGAVFCACYARYLTVDHTMANFAACHTTTGYDGGPGLDTSKPRDGSPYAGYTLYRAPTLDHGASPPADLALFARDIVHDVSGQVRVSLAYHSNECRWHDYSSRWYTWPVLAHPVLFYVGSYSVPADHSAATANPAAVQGQVQGQAKEGEYITNLGNPAVWWLSIPALLFCVVSMTRGRLCWRLAPLALLSVALTLMILSFRAAEHHKVAAVSPGPVFALGVVLLLGFCAVTLWCAVALRRFVPAAIVLGYLAAWMMWTFGNQERVLFLYHMLGALPFMALALAYALTALRGARVRLGSASLSLRGVAWTALSLIVAAFVFFYPVWTGMPQSAPDHAARSWFDSWFLGWP